MAQRVVVGDTDPRIPWGRHPDGAWMYAPLGELWDTDDGSYLICHVCGDQFTRLSGAHLAKHALTQHAYRERFGLNRSTSLMAPVLREQWRREGLRRYRDIDAVSSGLSIGQAMARDGTLVDIGQAAQPKGSLRAQGRKTRSRIVTPTARRNAAEAAARRDRLARSLGYPDADAYVQERSRAGDASAGIARDLATSQAWVLRTLAATR